MGINKYNLNKTPALKLVDPLDVKEMEKEAKAYRRIVVQIIDEYIETLQTPMETFDVVNYGLYRSFKDGGISALTKLKGVIDD